MTPPRGMLRLAGLLAAAAAIAPAAPAATPAQLLPAIAGVNEPVLQQARLAQAQALDARVREYAALLLNDHGQLSDRLAALANAQAVKLPPVAASGTLQGLSGKQFDVAYLRAEVQLHQKLLATLATSGSGDRASEVESLARELQSTEQAHLRSARQLLTDIEQGRAAPSGSTDTPARPPRNTVGPGNSAGGGHGYGPNDGNRASKPDEQSGDSNVAK